MIADDLSRPCASSMIHAHNSPASWCPLDRSGCRCHTIFLVTPRSITLRKRQQIVTPEGWRPSKPRGGKTRQRRPVGRRALSKLGRGPPFVCNATGVVLLQSFITSLQCVFFLFHFPAVSERESEVGVSLSKVFIYTNVVARKKYRCTHADSPACVIAHEKSISTPSDVHRVPKTSACVSALLIFVGLGFGFG